MRLFLLGGSGLLGTEVSAAAWRAEIETVAPSATEFDVTDPMNAARLASGEYGRFDWCINCAAYTAVDNAETEQDAAFSINALAPAYLSKAASAIGAAFLQISTDFVFDGSKGAAYTHDDKPNPASVYGRSKLAGEEAALAGNPQASVVRTAWLFGAAGKCFPRTMIGAWLAGKHLKVVADQLGSPTYSRDLASTLVACCKAGLEPGIYHAAGPRACSWYELAVASIEAYCKVYSLDVPQIESVQSSEWPTPAIRPRCSVLDSTELFTRGLLQMRPLNEALTEFAREIGPPSDVRPV